MPKSVGVYVDVSNLYYCIGKRFKNRKLDYRIYLDFIRDFGEVTVAKAYGAQIKNQANSFLHCLKRIGFEPEYEVPKQFAGEDGTIKKKANYDVKITVDMIQASHDIYILGSADGDFAPLVTYLRGRGAKVIVCACKISGDLHSVADLLIEIPESFLEKKKWNYSRKIQGSIAA
jgi:uncharacterized LabA/DUF88 family protein